MPTILTQAGKFISIATSLGLDELLLLSLSGAEHLSKPFSFQIEMLSLNNDIDPNDILGKQVDIKIGVGTDVERVINGYVHQFVAGERHSSGYRVYQAEVVPWLLLLSYHYDCRVFQEKEATDIIKEVFQSRGFSDFEIDTQRQFRKREYTVQYRESDFQFVSRLMEEEGIFYYFKHEEGRHTLILADATSSYRTCDEDVASYFESGGIDDHLNDWFRQRHFVSGKWSQNDYNFRTPSTSLLSTVSSIIDVPPIADFEHFHYPGGYTDRSEGDALTRIRMEEEETKYHTIFAAGTYRSFCPGGVFMLGRHDIVEEAGKEYVITTISHYVREHSYDGGSGAHDYRNKFECIPADVVFRPPSMTRKPFVQGPQTAVVVGPDGEEIYVDEFGRVKVQFHWDRVGQNDDKSSCWIRVGQQWAGQKWGAIFIPRVGHEVIVSFLEGDPDRPIIIGSVYNQENMPPYELPANKTQSGWKSRSSKGGSSSNYNEIRFEDLKGSEEILIHAERNLKGVVEANESKSIGHNKSLNVGNDSTTSIGNDEKTEIANNKDLSVGADRMAFVGGNDALQVAGDQDVSILSNLMHTVSYNSMENVGVAKETSIGGAYQISVGAAMNETVVGAKAEEVGGLKEVAIAGLYDQRIGEDKTSQISKNLTYDVGEDITLKNSGGSLVIKKDGKIELSGLEIELKTAAGSIKIASSGIIDIKGTMVKINS